MVSYTESDLNEFKADVTEILALVEGELIALERSGAQPGGAPFASSYAAIFRGFHNLKGAAGFFGMEALEAHMHCLETQLQECRELKQVSGNIIGYFLAGVDAARSILEGQGTEFKYRELMEKRAEQAPEKSGAVALTLAPGPDGQTLASVVPLAGRSSGRNPEVDAALSREESFPRGFYEKIKWQEKYSTGIPELDFPHQFILAQFSLATDLFMARNVDCNQLALVIAELIGILRLHFAIEDQLMHETCMPADEMESHRLSHMRAAEKLRTYEQDLVAGAVIPSRVIIVGLVCDFLEHMCSEAVLFRRKSCA